MVGACYSGDMNKKVSIIVTLVTLILVAGGVWWFVLQSDADDELNSQQQNGQSSIEATDESSQEAPTGFAGTVTVDGTSYTIYETIRCEPFEDERLAIVERELELQGFGEQNGERVQIDVYIEAISGTPSNSISWSGPEGVYGMGEALSADITQADGRVSGSAELVDARTFSDSINVEFQLDVPADTFACR